MADTLIETPGRPPIRLMPRDVGGWIISQNRNRIWLSRDEAAAFVKIIKEGKTFE